MDNYFIGLNAINVNDKVERKNGLTYLSWAWAWGEIKKLHADATYTIYENAQGWNYHSDGKTCWVKTGVTVQGIEHIEYLPVMDYRNASIPAEKVTSFDVNKAIQRSLTKAVARHGLGLYIYAGEDLPEGENKQDDKPVEKTKDASRPERIKRLCAHHGITMDTFGDILQALQADGKVPSKATKDMTESEFGVMLSLMHEAVNATKAP